MNRIEFLKMSTGILGGLSMPGVFRGAGPAAETASGNGMVLDDAYLHKGLNALARAHQMSAMAGHLGASLVAGYLLTKQHRDFDAAVCKGIEGDLDQVLAGESVFGAKMKKTSKLADAELFEPFPKEVPNESLIDSIAEALAKNIQLPRESGHNVIFAAIAIDALKASPEFATPSIVDGIRKLIGLFDQAHPGSGYYGKAKGRIPGNKINLPDDDEDTPEYHDEKGMVAAVLEQLRNQDPATHVRGYGGLTHIHNHAAAITDLARHGYQELAKAAITSHRQHFRLWRNLPNVAEEFGPQPFSKYSPYTADYWTEGKVPYDRALLTHRVKTMFGLDQLAPTIHDQHKQQQACNQLRYLM